MSASCDTCRGDHPAAECYFDLGLETHQRWWTRLLWQECYARGAFHPIDSKGRRRDLLGRFAKLDEYRVDFRWSHSQSHSQ